MGINRTLILYAGSSLMLREMMKMLESVADVTLVGISTGSRIGHTFRVARDIDDAVALRFPSIKTARALDIPKIIHLKQPPRHTFSGSSSKNFARPSHDMRAMVPRTKPRKRNGSR